MDSSEAIKVFVEEQIARLEKYAEKAMEAHVILSVEKYMQVAEVVLTAKGIRATGTASTSDLYASIDEAIGKVQKSLKKHHDKKVKGKNPPSRDAIVP